MSTLKGLSNFELFALFNVEAPSDAVRMEVADRTGGVVPVDVVGDSKSINKDVFDSFINYSKALQSAGRSYSNPEFRGHKLIAIGVYLQPKPVKLACEPYTRHLLLPDGEDPETTIKFPVSDKDLMSKHAWLAKYLPSKSATFSPNDDDQIAGLVRQVAGEIEMSLNVKNLLTKWGKAAPSEREEAEKLLSITGTGITSSVVVPVEPEVRAPEPKPVQKPILIPSPKPNSGNKTVVILCALEDASFAKDAKKHLASLRNSTDVFCVDLDVNGGEEASKVNNYWMNKADVVLYFLTIDTILRYPASQIKPQAPYARIVPVHIKNCDVPPELTGLVAIPNEVIATSRDRDSAWVTVSGAVRRLLGV